jgi:hypothetical protein
MSQPLLFQPLLSVSRFSYYLLLWLWCFRSNDVFARLALMFIVQLSLPRRLRFAGLH